MTKLEKLAKAAFERYSDRVTGEIEDWGSLSKERRKAWMLETLVLVDSITIDLKKEFKDMPAMRPNTTSYYKGYNEGMAEERIGIKNFIQNFLDKLEDDLVE